METRCGQPQQSNHQSKPSMTNCGTLSHLIRNATLWVVCFVLLGFLTACGSGNRVQPTGTAAPTAETLATATAPAESQLSATGAVLFITPRPVRAEEPLTGAGRDIPSVFDGITKYEAIQAELQTTVLSPPPATTLAEAAKAVVKILRCDNFGCETAVGSGVIIHPSGLILTAYHVLLRDPDDPTSPRYEEFVIAPTIDTRTAPQPVYRAHMVAEKREQDLALLQIDHTVDNTELSRSSLNLPTLPLADVSDLFGAALQVLGYPVNGGEAISIDRTDFRSFDDDGRLIVVDRSLNPGNSGGPALVEQANRFAVAGIVVRRRSTQGQLNSEGLVRAIDQLQELSWSPRVERAWSTEATAAVVGTGEVSHLQFALPLQTLDLVDRRLRLLFYAIDADTERPWQPVNTDGPLVIWADVVPQQALMDQTVVLMVPIASLGIMPDQMHFHALLWDWDEQETLWTDALTVRLSAQVVVQVDTITPTSTPLPTPTSTSTATPMPTSTDTPTPVTQPTMIGEVTNNLPPSVNADPNLAIGKRAVVASGISVSLVSEPVPDEEKIIGMVEAGTEMTIIDGPILTQGNTDTIVWWKVRLHDGLEAWAPANTSDLSLLTAVPEVKVMAEAVQTATPTITPAEVQRPESNGIFFASNSSHNLDAKFDDWEDNWIPINTIVEGRSNYSGMNDVNGDFQVSWTAEGLNIAVRVHDDHYRAGSTGTEMWQGDSLEIQFDRDLSSDFSDNFSNNDDYMLGIAFGKERNEIHLYRWLPQVSEGLFSISGAVTAEGEGYNVEVLIPWTLLDVTEGQIKSGQVFGFNLSINDNDSDLPANEGVLSASPARTTYNNPVEWGTLILQ